MQIIRSVPLALAIALLFSTGCGNSDDTQATIAVSNGSQPIDGSGGLLAIVNVSEETAVYAETDRTTYFAGDSGIATLLNSGLDPVFLPGCAPFVFEQSLDGDWAFVGPPFVCVWEGIAIYVGRNETDSIEFTAPSESGFYRLRYDYSSGCESGLPLSQANCDDELLVYSNAFEVVREACDLGQPGCRFVPAALNVLCADGVNFSGPSAECTRDPATWDCGYEFLSCP